MSKPSIFSAEGNEYIAAFNQRSQPTTVLMTPVGQRRKNRGGLVGGVGYAVGSAAAGLAGVFEGIGDFVTGTAALFSGDKAYAEHVYSDDVVGGWKRDMDLAYNPGSVMRFVGDAAMGVGQSSVFLVPHVGPALFFAGVIGGSTGEAVKKTGEVGLREYIYGAASGATEGTLEWVTGAGGQLARRIYGKAATKAGGAILGSIGKKASEWAAASAARGVLKDMVSSAAGEFVEEFLGDYTDVLWSRVTGVDPEASTTLAQAMYSGLVGAASGAFMAGTASSINTGRLYSSGKRVMDNGNVDATIKTAETVANSFASETGKGVPPALSDLKQTLTAYNGLADKTGTNAAIMLGRLKADIFYTQSYIGVQQTALQVAAACSTSADAAAKYAAYMSYQTGKEYTAEDFINNKDEIRDLYAVEAWAMTFLGDSRAQADMAEMRAIIDADKAATAAGTPSEVRNISEAVGDSGAGWDGSDAVYKVESDISGLKAQRDKELGITDSGDTGEVDYIRVKKLGEDSYSVSWGATADLMRGFTSRTGEQVREILGKIAKADSALSASIETYKAANANPFGRTRDKYESAARAEKALGALGDTMDEATAAEPNRSGVTYTAAEQDAARDAVKGFDALHPDTRSAIMEWMRSVAGLDKKTQRAVAQIMAARPGLYVLNAELGEGHRGLHSDTLKSGKRLIVVDAKTAGDAALQTITHELVHDIESTRGYAKLKKAAVASTSEARRREITDMYVRQYGAERYTDWLGDRQGTSETWQEYLDAHPDIDGEAVTSEVVAKAVGEKLGDLGFIRKYGEKNILTRALGSLKRLYKALRADKATGAAIGTTAKLGRMFEAALGQMGENAGQGATKYSFAGEKSKTADLTKLETAKRMLADGVEPEPVRKETGWFRGADGKWRYEIDNSNVKLRYEATLYDYVTELREKNRAWNKLTSRELSDKQIGDLANYMRGAEADLHDDALYAKLSEELGDDFDKWALTLETVKEAKKGMPDYITLGDLLDAPELFEAYPDMAELIVTFQALENGQKGGYSRKSDSIELSRDLKRSPELLLDTLIHEAQHAIQNREGFASGANPSYWNRRLENGYDGRTAAAKREMQGLKEQYDRIVKNDPQFASKMKALEAMTPTVPRGKVNWDTLEKIEPDPPEWVRFDKRRSELEKQYGADRVMSWISLQDKISRNARVGERGPARLYHDTAGEIEARDASSRRGLTMEERRSRKPDTGDEDTVFAYGDTVSYLFDENVRSTQSKAIISLIASNTSKISDDIVFDEKSVDIRRYAKKSDYVLEVFNRQNNIAYNSTIGNVELVKSGAKSTMLHGFGKNKIAAIPAIKSVIENGNIISFAENYSNSYDRYVIAAKGKIDGKNAIVGVVVNSYRHNGQKKFYLHEVTIAKAESSSMTGSRKGEVTVNGSASANSISQTAANVNSVDKNKSEKKFDLDENVTADNKKKAEQKAAREKRQAEATRRSELENNAVRQRRKSFDYDYVEQVVSNVSKIYSLDAKMLPKLAAAVHEYFNMYDTDVAIGKTQEAIRQIYKGYRIAYEKKRAKADKPMPPLRSMEEFERDTARAAAADNKKAEADDKKKAEQKAARKKRQAEATRRSELENNAVRQRRKSFDYDYAEQVASEVSKIYSLDAKMLPKLAAAVHEYFNMYDTDVAIGKAQEAIRQIYEDYRIAYEKKRAKADKPMPPLRSMEAFDRDTARAAEYLKKAYADGGNNARVEYSRKEVADAIRKSVSDKSVSTPNGATVSDTISIDEKELRKITGRLTTSFASEQYSETQLDTIAAEIADRIIDSAIVQNDAAVDDIANRLDESAATYLSLQSYMHSISTDAELSVYLSSAKANSKTRAMLERWLSPKKRSKNQAEALTATQVSEALAEKGIFVQAASDSSIDIIRAIDHALDVSDRAYDKVKKDVLTKKYGVDRGRIINTIKDLYRQSGDISRRDQLAAEYSKKLNAQRLAAEDRIAKIRSQAKEKISVLKNQNSVSRAINNIRRLGDTAKNRMVGYKRVGILADTRFETLLKSMPTIVRGNVLSAPRAVEFVNNTLGFLQYAAPATMQMVEYLDTHPDGEGPGSMVQKYLDEIRDPDSIATFFGDLIEPLTSIAELGKINTEIENAPLQIERALTLDELNTIAKAMQTIISLDARHGRVYVNGEWVDSTPYSDNLMTSTAEMWRGSKTNMQKFFTSAGILETVQPDVFAHIIEGTFGDKKGVLTVGVDEITKAANQKIYDMIGLMEPIDNFLNDGIKDGDKLLGGKEYKKHYERDKVKLTIRDPGKGTKTVYISVGEALSLTATWKRAQARPTLALNAFEFSDVKGRGEEFQGRVFERIAIDEGMDPSSSEFSAFMDQMMNQVGKSVAEVESQLTDSDKKFRELGEQFFAKSKELKMETDIILYGKSNIIAGYYFPILRSALGRDMDYIGRGGFEYTPSTRGYAWNKRTLRQASGKIVIKDFYDVISNHADQLTSYKNYSIPLQNFQRIINTKTSFTAKDCRTAREYISRYVSDAFDNYVSKYISDVQGRRRVGGEVDRKLERFLGRGVSNVLGLNIGSMIRQFGSACLAQGFLPYSSWVKGFIPRNSDKMTKYSIAAKNRTYDSVFLSAASGLRLPLGAENIPGAAMITLKKGDEITTQMLWSMCQCEVERSQGLKIGSEENLIEAGKKLDWLISKCQDTSDDASKSALSRSDNRLWQMTTMFRNQQMKVWSNVVSCAWEAYNLKQIKKSGGTVSESQAKQARTRASKLAAGIVTGAVFSSAVAALLSSMRGNRDDDDEPIIKSMALDTLGDILGTVPLAGQLAQTLLTGYDAENFYYGVINDGLDAVKAIYSPINKWVTGKHVTTQDTANAIRKGMLLAGQLTGVPVRNFENIVKSATHTVSPTMYRKYKSLFYAPTASDVKKAIDSGNTRLAETEMRQLMLYAKTGSRSNAKVNSELTRLYGAGYKNVVPRAVPSNVTVDDESIELSRDQYKQFARIYQSADNYAAQLVTTAEYAELDDEYKSKAIKSVYDIYYSRAAHNVLGRTLTTAAALSYMCDDIPGLVTAAAHIAGLKTDEDGERADKVRQYVGGFPADMQPLLYYIAGMRSSGVKSSLSGLISGLPESERADVSKALKIGT